MKGWIELKVRCHTEQSKTLEELDLEFSEHTQYNNTLIQISSINSIQLEYSDESIKGSLVYLNGECIEVEETPDEIIKLIKQND